MKPVFILPIPFCRLKIVLLLLIVTPFAALKAQGFGAGVDQLEASFNAFLSDGFEATTSLFYYSDIACQNDGGNLDRAVLTAISGVANNSMIFNTDVPVYVILDEGSGTVYISRDSNDLTNYGSYSPQYSNYINSPALGRNANLSFFMVPIQEDQSGENWMYVDGIGTVIIHDIDPNTNKGMLIPAGQMFSIQTIPLTATANSCGNSGNHALKIRW